MNDVGTDLGSLHAGGMLTGRLGPTGVRTT